MRKYLFALLLAAAPSLRAQSAAAGSLTIVKPDGSSLVMTEVMLSALPREKFEASSHDKKSLFEGSDLRTVLTLAGLKETEGLRGQALARIVTVVAADGYKVVLPLSDLDPSIGNLKVFLVNRMDGAQIPEEDGHWRLVIPTDVRPARWVKLIVRIEVSDPK